MINNKVRVPRTSLEEKKDIMMYKFLEDGRVKVYSKTYRYENISHEEFSARDRKVLSYTHLMVKEDDKLNISLRKQHKLFVKKANFLKQLTKGKINLYKTGDVTKTAMQLFYDLCNPPVPEKISEKEMEFLSNCRGQLVYAINYKGKGCKLDIVSEYPSIMRSEHFQIPIKEGKIETITKEEFEKLKYFKFGIYRVKILSRINPFIFRLNDANYYTHIDLNFAMKLGYKMELIEDGYENFLSYEGCLINGSKLFRPFVDYLFNLKNKGYKIIKDYLNRLWGALCQKNVITIDTEAKNNKIYEKKELYEIRPICDDLYSTNKYKIDVCSKEKYYKSEFARIIPFMLAKGRYTTAQYILKNIDDVVYVNTDGFILKGEEPKEQYKISSDIGGLKFEGKSEYIEVKSTKKVTGFEKVSSNEIALLENDIKLYERKTGEKIE